MIKPWFREINPKAPPTLAAPGVADVTLRAQNGTRNGSPSVTSTGKSSVHPLEVAQLPGAAAFAMTANSSNYKLSAATGSLKCTGKSCSVHCFTCSHL